MPVPYSWSRSSIYFLCPECDAAKKKHPLIESMELFSFEWETVVLPVGGCSIGPQSVCVEISVVDEPVAAQPRTNPSTVPPRAFHRVDVVGSNREVSHEFVWVAWCSEAVQRRSDARR
jgi:hypothetical protein